MIRFDQEVSVLLVAGMKCDLDAETARIRQHWASGTNFPHRSHITPAENLELRAEPLPDDPTLWKHVVLLRFDIATRTVDVHSVYADWGQIYSVITDDLDAYLDDEGNFFSDDLEAKWREAKNIASEYGSLIDLCKSCLLLPRFFHDHEDDIVIERHPTSFREFRKLTKNRKTIERVPSELCVPYREVTVLRQSDVRFATQTSFLPPEFKVETSGFWKKLDIDATGFSKSGQQIQGRTWVNKTLSWVENNPRNTTLHTSSTARRTDSPSSGYIYVMRSAAHAKDIFKVGLTRRTTDVRSSELSNTTSSPDQFLVVQEWETSDCISAERMIHEELAQYRVNPSREYFKAPYKAIFTVIDKVISSLEGGAAA